MNEVEIVGLDPETEAPIRVKCEKGIIVSVEPADVESELYLSPGLIDLQVNGYAGVDLNAEQISAEIVLSLVDQMLANGVTCFVPTLITAPEERICRALRVIADARRLYFRVAECVPFIHVEGPHISPIEGYRGAHPEAFIRPPSIAEFGRWQRAAGGAVGKVTLSPHYQGSVEYIEALSKQGVHVSIGHTHASPEQIRDAVDAGARLSTHLGNGLADVIARHQNPIWMQLADDRLSTSFIADGHHLPAYVFKAMLRAKGIDRAILVSDSVALAGMPPGVYTSAIGGQVELRPDGRLCMKGSEYLAGSTASLSCCVANAIRSAGIPLKDALRMATVNPGTFVGGRGRLAVGARADFIRFRMTGTLAIADVWLAGERVYADCERGDDGRAV
ncbi:MAG: amidohydrolase family protein [Acidobacteria bacterium]|nr:amidohydrolase family protein [Acidobacteriota bacterium]